MGPGKRERENDEKTVKRTKYEDRTDEGKTEKNDPPQKTKQNSTSHALPDPTPDPQKQIPAVNPHHSPPSPDPQIRSRHKT
jgi:hypothetical protein